METEYEGNQSTDNVKDTKRFLPRVVVEGEGEVGEREEIRGGL
jgi:hypothetical protein